MTKGMKTQSMTRTCIKPVNDNVNWGSSLWLSFMFSPCEGSEGTWRNPVIPHQFKRSCFECRPITCVAVAHDLLDKKRNAACWSVMHGSNCLSVMLVLVRHDVQQHLIFLETLSMLTTQKKGNMNWEVTSSLLQLSERTTNHVGHQQKHHFWVSINHTAMQQLVENIPMTEQQTDANWRQVHPGGERKEMRKKQRWNHSPQSQDPKRTEMKQSFNEEDSRQKKLSKDGFQAAGVTKGAIYLIWQSMTKR